MLVIEFCKMCQIEGTEMVCRYDEPSKSVVVTWEFPVPNHPTVTHGSTSQIFDRLCLSNEGTVILVVDCVRQKIKNYLENRNAQTA